MERTVDSRVDSQVDASRAWIRLVRRRAWSWLTQWAAPRQAPSPIADRVSRGVIIGGGVLVFALFAFAHLGLGAWLMPPTATAQQQSVTAGPYVATLVLNHGQFTVGQNNDASLRLRDAAGKAVDGATVTAQPVMLTMAMVVPQASVAAQGGGTYTLRPAFSMAGSWALNVTITHPGQPIERASFPVSVRWP